MTEGALRTTVARMRRTEEQESVFVVGVIRIEPGDRERIGEGRGSLLEGHTVL